MTTTTCTHDERYIARDGDPKCTKCNANLSPFLSRSPREGLTETTPEEDDWTSGPTVEGYNATFWHGSYMLLRDAITKHLADCIEEDDVAEESILVDAVERAAARLSARSSAETGTTTAEVRDAD